MKNSSKEQAQERESGAAREISAIRKSHGQPDRNRVTDFGNLDEQREDEENMKEYARYIEGREACPRVWNGVEEPER